MTYSSAYAPKPLLSGGGERVAISERAMACQAGFWKHRAACRTRDTPYALSSSSFVVAGIN